MTETQTTPQVTFTVRLADQNSRYLKRLVTPARMVLFTIPIICGIFGVWLMLAKYNIAPLDLIFAFVSVALIIIACQRLFQFIISPALYSLRTPSSPVRYVVGTSAAGVHLTWNLERTISPDKITGVDITDTDVRIRLRPNDELIIPNSAFATPELREGFIASLPGRMAAPALNETVGEPQPA
jgi:hypothetical protein